MSSSECCVRIVRTKAGQRTGETIYVTEDGRTWTNEIPLPNHQRTGIGHQTFGFVHGDHMCSHPR